MLLLVTLLVVGTFQIGFLKQTYASLTLPIGGVGAFQDKLTQLVPFDATKGEEGVTTQGVLLIGLLLLVGIAAWRGIDRIYDGYNRWTYAALILIGSTLVLASLGMSADVRGLTIAFTGKFFGVLLTTAALGWMIEKRLTVEEKRDFLWESWKFIKQIFPLLIVGVFIVGVLRVFIKPEWIEVIAGRNTVLGNFIGVVFGVFMYFPTLVEVPIAQMFLKLGMHRGPLLAYLMADPELSLQSILIVSAVIGKLKTWTYVGWVALFSMLAGLIYGSWVDGASIGLVLLYLAVFLALLVILLWALNRRNNSRTVSSA